MKKGTFMTTFTKNLHRTGLKMKKHSPEIMMVAGAVGIGVAFVMACKASMKVNDILEDAKSEIEDIHTEAEEGTCEIQPTEEETSKALTHVYVHTGLELVKLYAPAVVIGGLSLASLLTSNRIYRNRYISAAAYAKTMETTLKEYRGRVVERFGKDLDNELRYNIKAKEVEETTVDENGNEVVTKKTVNAIDPTTLNEFAVFYEEYVRDKKGGFVRNPDWCEDNEYNIAFLRQRERYANDILHSRGHVFLNEVRALINLPPTKAGQLVGWVDDPNGDGDCFVDFGLTESSQNYMDFLDGTDEAILLNFNVDGNILELI